MPFASVQEIVFDVKIDANVWASLSTFDTIYKIHAKEKPRNKPFFH